MYSLNFLKVINDNNIILTGTTKYLNGVLGVSTASQTDTIIVKTDQNFNTKWIVSVDINNASDITLGHISDENTSYCMSFNSKFVSWLFSLNYTSGVYITSKWHQHNSTSLLTFSSSSLKDIQMVSLDGDRLIIFIPLYKNNYSKLMFCKHINN